MKIVFLKFDNFCKKNRTPYKVQKDKFRSL